MRARQKQAIDAYHRVQAFLAEHQPPETPGYRLQKQALDGIVARLDDHTVEQAAGRRLRAGEVARERALVKVLREHHLAPISQIARAFLANAPGVEKLLKMPDYYITSLELIAEAKAMRRGADLYEAQFANAGRAPDFLEQLDAAVEALEECLRTKTGSLGRQIGGTAGIAFEIKRGRTVVDVLDTIVQDAFRDDRLVLAEWRSAKRVRGVPGGGPSRVSVGATASEAVVPRAGALELVA